MKIVIGNKTDAKAERQVTTEDIANFTKETGIEIIETSAKIGENVEVAFTALTKKLISAKSKKVASPQYTGVKLGEKLANQQSGKCCGGSSS